ncbi:MAG TPA: 2-oxoacid:acceptor oxidoreductase family protein [Candidatus Dormibacteraeota bacterium]|nr:2-oxoacid:acceptor oxidoreductase family protein [Candidatus Dormibacteraeota bacterium]
MVQRIRFHGRGGEGVKLASRIVSRAAFLSGCEVQDSPIYGAERRGAPVVAFTRLSAERIAERGYVLAPDAVVVMDQSLLDIPEAAVLDGVDEATLVLINSPRPAELLCRAHAIVGRVRTRDLTGMALAVIGHPTFSALTAAFTVRAAALTSWKTLATAIRVELGDAGVGATMIARNLDAARALFDTVAVEGVRTAPPAARPAPPPPPFVVPHLPGRLAAPAIEAAATSAARHTEGWRTHRPLIDRARCTRCILCFALCPEGAISLDAERWPVVDYDHCKGCLVCVTECPPTAITAVREVAA